MFAGEYTQKFLCVISMKTGKAGKKKLDNKQNEVFTKKEQEILTCILQGMNAYEIAEELSISPEKLTTYRRQMIRKANEQITFGTMAYGFFAGVSQPDDMDISFIY